MSPISDLHFMIRKYFNYFLIFLANLYSFIFKNKSGLDKAKDRFSVLFQEKCETKNFYYFKK